MSIAKNLMDALLGGELRRSDLDYEIIDVTTTTEGATAWIEVDGQKFTVRVEERED